MTQYAEIVNPSDPYTISVDDYEAAAAGALWLFEGRYGLADQNGQTLLPIFLFGKQTEAINEFWQETFGRQILGDDSPYYKPGFRLRMADALDTVVIGSFSDRKTYDLTVSHLSSDKFAPEFSELAEFKAKWHDQKRSSMNDIGQGCWDAAKGIQEYVAEETQS